MLIFVVRVLYLLLPVVLLGLKHILVDALVYAVKHYLVPLLLEQLFDVLCHLRIAYARVVTLLSLVVHKVTEAEIPVGEKALERDNGLLTIVFKQAPQVFLVWPRYVRMHWRTSTSGQKVGSIHVCDTDLATHPVQADPAHRAKDLEDDETVHGYSYFMSILDKPSLCSLPHYNLL